LFENLDQVGSLVLKFYTKVFAAVRVL